MTNILQADNQDKAPTTDYPRELRQLTALRDTLIKLPCSPEVEPILAELTSILEFAHGSGRIDGHRLQILVHAAKEGSR